MMVVTTTGIHFVTRTIIEDSIKERMARGEDPYTRNELWRDKLFPSNINFKAYKEILSEMITENKIIVENTKLIWIHNPTLFDKMVKASVEVDGGTNEGGVSVDDSIRLLALKQSKIQSKRKTWKLSEWNEYFAVDSGLPPMTIEEIQIAIEFLKRNLYPAPEDCPKQECPRYRPACDNICCTIAIRMCGMAFTM